MQAESVCVTLFSSSELSFWRTVSSKKVSQRNYLEMQARPTNRTCPGVNLAACEAGKHPKANHKPHRRHIVMLFPSTRRICVTEKRPIWLMSREMAENG